MIIDALGPASRKIALAVVPVNRAFAFNSCASGVGNRIATLVVIHANVGEKRLNASSVWRLLTKLMYHLVDQMFPQKYWTLACTLAVAIIAAACGDVGSTTHYYDPAVLRGRYLPTWDGTNQIPLSPDKAVAAALKFANSKASIPVQWKIQQVTLQTDLATTNWYYNIYLLELGGQYRTESIHVLLNGEIWKPRETVVE